jgi:ketosteroid isomerase-like protein
MAVTTSTETEASRATVLKFLEVFSSGDVPAILDMMTDDATWWVAGTIPLSGTKDRKGFGEMLSGVSDTCKGPIKLTPHGVTAEGERVAVETESYAELNNGRIYNNQYHFLFRVRDGKIAEVKEYLDTMHTNDIFFG